MKRTLLGVAFVWVSNTFLTCGTISGPVLTSMYICRPSRASASTSSRSAGRVPLNFEPFHLPQLPTSTFSSSAHVVSLHPFVLAPSVVRFRSRSWNVNTRPSFER